MKNCLILLSLLTALPLLAADAPKPNASASSKIRDGADGIRWKPNRRGPSVNGSPRGLRHRDGG